jgi:hypothetical protein
MESLISYVVNDISNFFREYRVPSFSRLRDLDHVLGDRRTMKDIRT